MLAISWIIRAKAFIEIVFKRLTLYLKKFRQAGNVLLAVHQRPSPKQPFFYQMHKYPIFRNRYFWQHTKPSSKYEKRKAFALTLDLPAFDQFWEWSWKRVDAPYMARRALSARDGCSATHLHDHSQNAADTRRAELSQDDFWLLFHRLKSDSALRACRFWSFQK